MTQTQVDGSSEDGRRAGTVRAPDLCRLTILAQRTQVDLALPLNVPVALLIPGIVDMVTAHVQSSEFDDVGEQFQPREWVLAQVGRPPLSSTLSLGEQGVRDGELLMLESAEHVAPPPLFDDIMYNVAQADADRYRRWTPALAKVIGAVLAVVSALAGCAALLWRDVGASDHFVGAGVTLAVTLLLLIAGVTMSRMYGDAKTALVLCGTSVPTAFTAGALLVPGNWSWSQIVVGAAMSGATAVLSLRVAGVGLGLFTGVTVTSAFIVPAAIVGLFVTQPVRVIMAVVTAVGLGALALAPRLSMLLARMPLPPVPTGGSSPDPTQPDPTDVQVMPTFAELTAKTERAHRYLAGLVGASTVLAVLGGLVSAAPTPSNSSIYWPGVALAAVVAVVLMMRGRTYANAEEAVTLFAGGAFMVVVLIVGAGAATRFPVIVFAVAIVIAMAALATGVIVPNRTATPPMRRAMELLEYAFVVAVVPLVCLVADLYATMRGL